MSRYWFKVVTRAGQGLGFRLAGAPVEEITEGEEASRMTALVNDTGLGVLAVQQELLGHVPQALLQRADREGIPIVVPFALPERWEEVSHGQQYVAALIRRAIGYHVKIQR
jgi:V/A-type H+-transporting ATPase subunit F